MVGALEETGAIGEIADGIGAVTDGDRTAELLGIAWVSAIGSGLVDNIPFTATMIPVVEQLQQGNNGDDAYWWALALGACFGGNATIIAAAANVAASGHGRARRPADRVRPVPQSRAAGHPGVHASRHRLHRSALPLMNPRQIAGELVKESPRVRETTRSGTPSAA